MNRVVLIAEREFFTKNRKEVHNTTIVLIVNVKISNALVIVVDFLPSVPRRATVHVCSVYSQSN